MSNRSPFAGTSIDEAWATHFDLPPALVTLLRNDGYRRVKDMDGVYCDSALVQHYISVCALNRGEKERFIAAERICLELTTRRAAVLQQSCGASSPIRVTALAMLQAPATVTAASALAPVRAGAYSAFPSSSTSASSGAVGRPLGSFGKQTLWGQPVATLKRGDFKSDAALQSAAMKLRNYPNEVTKHTWKSVGKRYFLRTALHPYTL
jgi:hypothetical protein